MCNLKSALVTWINTIYGTSDPPLKCCSKLEWGLDNDHIGCLLCPAEYDWDNKEWVLIDCITIMHSISSVFKRVRIKIRDGHSNFAVTNTSWPAFCYPNSKQCSSQDIEKGLFRGELLIKVTYCYQSVNLSYPGILAKSNSNDLQSSLESSLELHSNKVFMPGKWLSFNSLK